MPSQTILDPLPDPEPQRVHHQHLHLHYVVVCVVVVEYLPAWHPRARLNELRRRMRLEAMRRLAARR